MVAHVLNEEKKLWKDENTNDEWKFKNLNTIT